MCDLEGGFLLTAQRYGPQKKGKRRQPHIPHDVVRHTDAHFILRIGCRIVVAVDCRCYPLLSDSCFRSDCRGEYRDVAR